MHRIPITSQVALIAVALASTACSGASDASPAPSSPPAEASQAPVTSSSVPATATAAAAELTFTIENDACDYAGPTTIPYGTLDMTLEVRDTLSSQYGLFLFVVEPGHTADEVAAAYPGDPPSWATLVDTYVMGRPGETGNYERNLRQIIAYKGGPIYVLCTRPERVLGLFGPIDVVG